MLAVTSYLGDLGQVIDLKEAGVGGSGARALLCTGAEGPGGDAETRHVDCHAGVGCMVLIYPQVFFSRVSYPLPLSPRRMLL